MSLWLALGAASCTITAPSCQCRAPFAPMPGHELDGLWEILPHKEIGPCTYQYEPPTRPHKGFVAVEIHEAAYPYYEVDKEKRILRITKCPDGGPPGGASNEDVDIVFNYDEYFPSAQPEYYERSSDERLRRMFPRKPPR